MPRTGSFFAPEFVQTASAIPLPVLKCGTSPSSVQRSRNSATNGNSDASQEFFVHEPEFIGISGRIENGFIPRRRGRSYSA
jgi:hypothetical protein